MTWRRFKTLFSSVLAFAMAGLLCTKYKYETNLAISFVKSLSSLYDGTEDWLTDKTAAMFHSSDGVLVLLHIQKTSGKAFNTRLVNELGVDPDRESGSGIRRKLTCSCKNKRLLLRKCRCVDGGGRHWLHSRLTNGWQCGVHPGWTDLHSGCLDTIMDRREGAHYNRSYLLITLLRDPVTRYVSEWNQVSTGEQWARQNIHCHPLNVQNLHCFKGTWHGVSFDKFLECRENPANNRQVRMLADLSLANCSEVRRWFHDVMGSDPVAKSVINNHPLLKSAKKNLHDMAFFGLTEYPVETVRLFERAFGVYFKDHPEEYMPLSSPMNLTEAQEERVIQLNRLDVALYQYAKQLFLKRLHMLTKRPV